MALENDKIKERRKNMSPRSHEIDVITNLIKDCFKKYSKLPKTSTEFYKVGKILGRGAFGKVHLGLHRLTRKLVAIKSLMKKHKDQDNEKRKMEHEIGILKPLRHPSLVKILETFEDNDNLLMVTELCPGGDLLNHVRKRRKLNEGQAKYIFKQIL
jgi:serine/threonine protein kinase